MPGISFNLATGELEPVELPSPSLAERKAVALQAVKAEQAARFAAGFSYDFGGAIGVHTLDLRGADDKANWHLALTKTDKLIAAGASAMPVNLRTATNETVAPTAAELNAALLAFLSWGDAMLERKWELDADIAAAVDETELDAIDVAAGWP